AFDDANAVLQADQPRQLACSFDPRRRQLDANDIGAITVREIARGTAKSGAKVGDPRALSDPGALRQGIVGGQSAVMILVVGKQFLGRNTVEVSSLRFQPREDDL